MLVVLAALALAGSAVSGASLMSTPSNMEAPVSTPILTPPGVLPTDEQRTAARQKAITAVLASPTDTITAADYAHMAASHLQLADQRLVDIMARYAIVDPWDVLHAARHEGSDLAVCCASLEMESWGGQNRWGSDPGGDALLDQYRGSYVTKGVFLGSYWPRARGGYVTNGCGPAQLTDLQLQQEAQDRGGCYVPLHNETVGDDFMNELIAQTGSVWLAFYHYNGSGQAAEDYANEAVGLYEAWVRRGI